MIGCIEGSSRDSTIITLATPETHFDLDRHAPSTAIDHRQLPGMIYFGSAARQLYNGIVGYIELA
jgi:hypothetical protein